MQQQQPPPQTASQPQSQPQTGQIMGQQGQQFQSQSFYQSAPQQLQQVVTELEEFEKIAEWAHTKSMEQGQHQVATITDQLAEIATLEKKLILGQSPFAQTFTRCTEQSIQEGVQQLQQYSQDPTVQEVVQNAQYLTQSIGQAQQQLQQWSQQGGMGQQVGGQPQGFQAQQF